MKIFNSAYKIILLLTVIASCTSSGGLKDQLVGKWKISEMKIQMLDQMDKMGQMQIQMIKDSIGKTTDTATLRQLKEQLANMQSSLDQFHSQQDSSMKSSLWEFKKDGSFTEKESDSTKAGTWSLDEQKMMLHTEINSQKDSVHVKLENELLTLQFDSLNYMSLSKMKE